MVGQARSTRSSRMESLVTTFVVAATCRIGGLAVTNAVVRHPGMVLVAYGLPLGMIVFSLILLQRAERQRAGLGIANKVADAMSALWDAARARFGGNAGKAVT
jgi:lipopolysaccharide export system permease protein